MGRGRNGKEKETKRKDPGDNGRNEAMDNGEKKMQGRIVKSDTRVNGKNGLATMVKQNRGQAKHRQGTKVKTKPGINVKTKEGAMVRKRQGIMIKNR